jgi:hypothetical protein
MGHYLSKQSSSSMPPQPALAVLFGAYNMYITFLYKVSHKFILIMWWDNILQEIMQVENKDQ